MIVGIDSMVLIYANLVPQKTGQKSGLTAEQLQKKKELSTRAKLLLHMLRDETIILPTIAIAELLVPVPAAKKSVLISTLNKRFLCAGFDLHAAAIASDIWAYYKTLPADQKYDDRNVLKADIFILAAVKAAGGKELYTHDAKFRNLASNFIVVKDLPIRDPSDMFALSDIESGDL